MSGNVNDVQAAQAKEAVTAEDNIKLQEMLRGYRILYFGEDHFLSRRHNIKAIRIYDKSTLSISRYGDEMFTKTRNRLMKDPEMLTYEEQMKYLTQRGLWDDEKEKELFDLRTKAREIQEDKSKVLSGLQEATSKKDIEKYKKEEEKVVALLKDIYLKYADLVTLNMMYFNDTIEIQAQTAQRKGWIVSAVCAHFEDDDDKYNPERRIWKSIAELEDDLKTEHLQSLIDECTMFWEFESAGGDSFFAESPEGLTSDSDSEPQKN